MSKNTEDVMNLYSVWAIEEYSDSDYRLWSTDNLDLDKLPDMRGLEVKPLYNQAEMDISRNGCVLYATMCVFSTMTGHIFTLEDRKEIVRLAIAEYGYNTSSGMLLYRWVDCIRHWYNAKFLDNQVKTYRVSMALNEAQLVLKKWYPIITWHKLPVQPKVYNILTDAHDNGVIDALSSSEYWQGKFGHAITNSIIWGVSHIVDNYNNHSTVPYNVYKHERVQQFANEGYHFANWYIILPNKLVDNTSEVERLSRSLTLNDAKTALYAWLWNGKDWQAPCTREQVASMVVRGMRIMWHNFEEK